MSGITVSTAGLFNSAVASFRAGQSELSVLQRQLASGRIADDLSAVPDQAPRLLDLDAAIATRRTYVEAIDRTRPRAQGTMLALERMAFLAADLGRAAMVAGDDGSADPAAVGARASAALQEIEVQLNLRIGGRALFAGNRPGLATVARLADLPVPPPERPPFRAAAPDLPAYDAAAPGADANAWQPDSLRIDDGESAAYGAVAVDPGIQDLVMGLRRLQTAVKDRDNFALHAETARELLARAQSGIRLAQNSVAIGQARMEAARERHLTAIAVGQRQRDETLRADPAELGARIAQLQVQLQASYATVARLRELSLANFVR